MKKAVIVDKLYGSVSPEKQWEMQQKLSEEGIELELCHCTTEEEIIGCARDAEVMLCTGNPPITEHVMASLPRLKAVIRMGIGVNSVDLEAAVRQNKIIMNLPGVSIQEIAMHGVALILALNRNIVYYDNHIRRGEWPKGKHFVPRKLSELTLGLIGFGGSAREMYKMMHFGFDCAVMAYDPYIPEAVKSEYDVSFVSFDELIENADIVSLHIPLNEETYHIIDRDVLHRMKKDAMVINIDRGGLIDQEALVEALDAGVIRCAGLDTFEQEPLPADSPLLKRDDVALSPHSAFYGEGSTLRTVEWTIEMTADLLNRSRIIKKRIANPGILPKLGETYCLE